MTSQCSFFRWATAVLGLAAFSAVFSAAVYCTAEDPPGDSSRRDKSDRSIREQDIYIPYTKLREVFEKQGRGVFLPYEQFQELWQAAREKTQPAAEAKPPAGGLITDITSDATVEKDVVRVKAALRIEILAEGWHSIPLRLADAGVIGATLSGKPARIMGDSAHGYQLLVEKKGKEAETMELRLEYAKAIARRPGLNSVSFQSPQSPVSRWRIVIPQTGVKVNLQPLIAATEVPAEKKAEGDTKKPEGDDKKPDETVVLAFVGAAPVVRIDWTPKAEGATGLAALASVQADQQVGIGEGVVRSRATLNYTISRAELAQLTIDVPADQKIINVFDANVRGWSVKAADGKQRITAELFEPAKASQQVIVELEKFLPGQAKGELAVPVVKRGRRRPAAGGDRRFCGRKPAGRGGQDQRIDAGRRRRIAGRGPARQLGVRLSLCHRAFRVGVERRKGAAADHGRFAGRGPTAARAAHGGRDGRLHHREGGRFHAGVGHSAGLRRF